MKGIQFLFEYSEPTIFNYIHISKEKGVVEPCAVFHSSIVYFFFVYLEQKGCLFVVWTFQMNSMSVCLDRLIAFWVEKISFPLFCAIFSLFYFKGIDIDGLWFRRNIRSNVHSILATWRIDNTKCWQEFNLNVLYFKFHLNWSQSEGLGGIVLMTFMTMEANIGRFFFAEMENLSLFTC